MWLCRLSWSFTVHICFDNYFYLHGVVIYQTYLSCIYPLAKLFYFGLLLCQPFIHPHNFHDVSSPCPKLPTEQFLISKTADICTSVLSKKKTDASFALHQQNCQFVLSTKLTIFSFFINKTDDLLVVHEQN